MKSSNAFYYFLHSIFQVDTEILPNLPLRSSLYNKTFVWSKSHLCFWLWRQAGIFDFSSLVNDTRDVTCLEILDNGDVITGDNLGKHLSAVSLFL